MDFRTIIPISPFENQIKHSHQLMMIGSCFTESIGERLQQAKFNVDINPFGIQYNPLSVASTLERLITKQKFTSNDIFQQGDQWHSFSHHSCFSGNTQDACLQTINLRLKQSTANLQQTDYLFITFGTAWVYELTETGQLVSNCHKLPDTHFTRRRLTVEEIVAKYKELIEQLNAQQPTLKIVFTVSPIRHWKDGAHDNNISKSILLLAIDTLQQEFDNVSYFPSYELIMDDLRDYRFYAEDMLHPNSTAIDYIWGRFSDCYFSAETKNMANEMEKLSRALTHRPFNAEGEEYKKFCEQQLNKIKHYEEAYPEIDFEEEKQKIKLINEK